MTETNYREKYCIRAWESLYVAMVKINENASRAVFVLDQDGRLVGSITDGDIRRALIGGPPSLDRPVREAMHREVRFLDRNTPERAQRQFMRACGIEQLPLVDEERRLVRVVLSSTLLAARRSQTPVLVMAGGRGSRLGVLTRDRPKPLVPLGDRPIMEHILAKFRREGFRRFYVAIHHFGEMVRDYFGDGAHFGVAIEYLVEHQPLGTAGALSLINDDDFESLVVSNCDVVCRMDYSDMLDFHESQGNDMTLGVVTRKFTIPFGVVDTVSSKIVGFREKPEYEVSVNAGLYVLHRDVVSDVPRQKACDMPELLERTIRRGRRCAAFTTSDEWVDAGDPEALEHARRLVAESATAVMPPAPGRAGTRWPSPRAYGQTD